MADSKTEMELKEILRLSNEESNRITKECIELAMIHLLEKKSLEDISITDLVKRAGVSRTAYYRNYNSKEDVLRSMMHDVVSTVTDSMFLYDPFKNAYEYWYAMFHTVREYEESLNVLFNSGFGEMILESIHNKTQRVTNDNNIFERYQIYFWNGAVYSVLAAWLKNGMDVPEDEMAQLCKDISRMALNSVKQ